MVCEKAILVGIIACRPFFQSRTSRKRRQKTMLSLQMALRSSSLCIMPTTQIERSPCHSLESTHIFVVEQQREERLEMHDTPF